MSDSYAELELKLKTVESELRIEREAHEAAKRRLDETRTLLDAVADERDEANLWLNSARAEALGEAVAVCREVAAQYSGRMPRNWSAAVECVERIEALAAPSPASVAPVVERPMPRDMRSCGKRCDCSCHSNPAEVQCGDCDPHPSRCDCFECKLDRAADEPIAPDPRGEATSEIRNGYALGVEKCRKVIAEIIDVLNRDAEEIGSGDEAEAESIRERVGVLTFARCEMKLLVLASDAAQKARRLYLVRDAKGNPTWIGRNGPVYKQSKAVRFMREEAEAIAEKIGSGRVKIVRLKRRACAS